MDSNISSIEAQRMKRMRIVLDKALKSCTKSLSKKNIEASFNLSNSKVLRQNKQILEELNQQLLGAICFNVKNEFSKMCLEKDLNGKLKQLEEMMEEKRMEDLRKSKELEQSLQDIIHPEQIVQQHRIHAKLREKERLLQLLQKSKDENQQLQANLDETKQTAFEEIEKIQSRMKD